MALIACAVTLLVGGAACAMRGVGFSRRECTKRERNIIDRIATIWDGLYMLKIALYG